MTRTWFLQTGRTRTVGLVLIGLVDGPCGSGRQTDVGIVNSGWVLILILAFVFNSDQFPGDAFGVSAARFGSR
jgi:hypothetical protein